MKIQSKTFFILGILSQVVAYAGAGQPTNTQLFALTPDYRGVVKLDAATISPFHKPEDRAAQVAANALKNPSGPNIAGVLSKFNELGLTGVVPSSSKQRGVIILGGQVFNEGDTLTFPQAKSKTPQPLLPSHTVVLTSVTQEGLSLSVSTPTDVKAPVPVPIGLLEFSEK